MNLPKARSENIVVQELPDEVLIYDLINHKAYTLNKMSAAVWNLCDGTRQVSEIAKALSNQLNQPVTDEFVYIALDQFKTDNLFAANETVEIKFDGLSRREVIRKVGLASMIALPVIVSLMAPTAAMAQSNNCGATANKPNGCPVGTPVTTGNQTCASSSDAERSSICDAFFGNVCSSTNAAYATGSCTQVGTNTQYNCVCAA